MSETADVATDDKKGGMSTRTKVFIAIGGWLLLALIFGILFGSDGKNEVFKPQEEFKLDSWIYINIGGVDLSVTKAVMYLWLASFLTIGIMVWIARKMPAEAEPGADRDRGRLRRDQDRHHRRQHRG